MADETPDVVECDRVFDRVQAAARALGVAEVEVLAGGGGEALTRFANNTIHQNVAGENRFVSVRVVLEGRTARATTNRWDDESLRRIVDDVVALTKALPPEDELLPMARPETITSVDRFDPATAETTPAERAGAVCDAIDAARASGQNAAGIFSTEQSFQAIYNSAGIRAFHRETMAHFSVTTMLDDSSGWAKGSSTRRSALDPRAMALRSCEKALLSRNPLELPPGAYTVILEPAAALDLIGQLFGDFSGTALADQRSFLTDRMDTEVFGDNIHIFDDVYHPLQAGAPFDGEGVPRQKLALVEAGVPKAVAYCRASAKRAGTQPTGHGFPLPNEAGEAPMNLVLAGGDTSLEQMITNAERAILVTRFWYIREVEPYEKIMTGMTRDGTFLVEDGKVTRGLRNFRFNQSLIEMLNNVESMSAPVRSSGEETFDFVVPAMTVRDFEFSEVTKF
jgi:PmbA protein